VNILSIVAHQDDSLLFMSPPLLEFVNELGQSGNPAQLTEVYLTAGDAGRDEEYWRGRQQGTMAGYDSMLGSTGSWTQGQRHVGTWTWEAWSRTSTAQLELLFVQLPDGNVDGSGFPSTGNESLKKLVDHDISDITDIGSQHQSYQLGDLQTAVLSLVKAETPDVIFLQDWTHWFGTPSSDWNDHADHVNGAAIALVGITGSGVHSTVIGFEGYQDSSGPANVDATELTTKTAAFTAYCQHDALASPTTDPYPAWLARCAPIAVRIS
jgi:hypothetical protein